METKIQNMSSLINWKDNKETEESLGRFSRYLYNKRVLFIGGAKNPSPYRVEDYDVIVAANSHSVRLSHPVDIIYTQSSDMPTALLRDPRTRDLKYFCINYSQMYVQVLTRFCEKHNIPRRYFLHSLWPTVNPIYPEFEPLCAWQKEIGTFVFVGILAIRDLLNHYVKSLTLRGFNFYFKPGQGSPKKVGKHEVEPQIVWLYRTSVFDKRLIIDEQLEAVFNHYS